jgi:3-methyladenine DNA glycosylase AlkD
MTAFEILAALRAQADPKNVAGTARYGISTAGTLGVPVAVIRRLARQAGHSIFESCANALSE